MPNTLNRYKIIMNPTTDITANRLFTLLRLALWQKEENIDLFDGITQAEWEAIYNLALEQGVFAIAFDGARMLPAQMQPDLDSRIQWGYNVGHIEKVFRHQVEVTEKVVSVFADKGIRTMIMKGISVAQYYPQPAHRQFGDIDIYLMGDYEKGNAIVAAKGTPVKYDYFVHSEFVVGSVNIENHKTFINARVNKSAEYVERELEQLATDLRPHPIVKGAYAPSPEFNALFLTRHATWHYARECVRLRDVCDWAMFLHHEADNMDTATVMHCLRESGLERYVAIITEICRTCLGLDKSLPFSAEYHDLAERVKEDILTFENPDKFRHLGIVRVFMCKIRNRFGRKWCYDLVVPDSFWGNIGYSIRNYLSKPWVIFKAHV